MISPIERFMLESVSYSLSLDGKAIFCRLCCRVSFHPQDVENRYCGFCHVFHDNQKLEESLKGKTEKEIDE